MNLSRILCQHTVFQRSYHPVNEAFWLENKALCLALTPSAVVIRSMII